MSCPQCRGPSSSLAPGTTRQVPNPAGTQPSFPVTPAIVQKPSEARLQMCCFCPSSPRCTDSSRQSCDRGLSASARGSSNPTTRGSSAPVQQSCFFPGPLHNCFHVLRSPPNSRGLNHITETLGFCSNLGSSKIPSLSSKTAMSRAGVMAQVVKPPLETTHV